MPFGNKSRFFVPDNGNKEKQMEGIFFLVFWLGGAALHTLFDIKIKPVLMAAREEGDFS